MTGTQAWWREWVGTVETIIGHVAAIVVGFIMMVVGLGLGVTMIMLPAGLVIGSSALPCSSAAGSHGATRRREALTNDSRPRFQSSSRTRFTQERWPLCCTF
jgi:hypothetical protein